ncbi:MAG: hypothetical protein Kow0069_23430 [Promethearchaeota archaeon]
MGRTGEEGDNGPFELAFALDNPWRLGLLELDHFLRRAPGGGRVVDYSTTVAVASFQRPLSAGEIETYQRQLGGVQKIAVVHEFIPREVFDAAFPAELEDPSRFQYGRRELKRALKRLVERVVDPKPPKRRGFVATSFYPARFGGSTKDRGKHVLKFLNDAAAKVLEKTRGLKVASFRYPKKAVETGNVEPLSPRGVLKHDLLDPYGVRADLFYAETVGGLYLAHTHAVTDLDFFKALERDRPSKLVKNYSTGVARSLVTFATARAWEADGGRTNKRTLRVLDPFCGDGKIVALLALLNHSIYASDASADAIEATRTNLKWFWSNLMELDPPNLGARRLVRCSPTRLDEYFPPVTFDAVVTWPRLLPRYEEKPSSADLRKAVKEVAEPTVAQFLEKAATVVKPGGRIVFTTPRVHAREGKAVGLNVPRLLPRSLEVVPPLDPFRLPRPSGTLRPSIPATFETRVRLGRRGAVVDVEAWILEKRGEEAQTKTF